MDARLWMHASTAQKHGAARFVLNVDDGRYEGFTWEGADPHVVFVDSMFPRVVVDR